MFAFYLFALGSGHAMLTVPKTRQNVAKAAQKEYDAHSMGQRGDVSLAEITVCGKKKYDGMNFKVENTWGKGEIIDVTRQMYAEHGGAAMIRIRCMDGVSTLTNDHSDWITLDAVQKTENETVPGKPQWVMWPERTCDKPGIYEEEHSNKFKLPDDFQCNHAVGQWIWHTANSGHHKDWSSAIEATFGCSPKKRKILDDPVWKFTHESFKNCFDFKISGSPASNKKTSSKKTSSNVQTSSLRCVGCDSLVNDLKKHLKDVKTGHAELSGLIKKLEGEL